MSEIHESTFDMMQLYHRLETLLFQIYAYQKSKEMEHQPLMEYNLYAIDTLCGDICSRLRMERSREESK